ncbi:hypothetical protein ACFVYR_21350 [Streptomyces sp. NPDC058284]|uniref:hypothetical protein n=1 Tax=unclassified Streptomyces TaxID=2593676 RepID=UPI00365DEB44
MAAESFSAAGDTSGTGEPLVSTSLHWGTAQLGAPPRPESAPWPQAADPGTDHRTGPAPGPATGDVPSERPAPAAIDRSSEEPVRDTEDEAVEELIRVAVVSRPLDDVVDLVTLLEQSPEDMPTAKSVLRLAAVARSVDDVTQLVERLGPPERPANHMDEAIRHAIEERPIPEVSRLVHLLSRPPCDPHSGAEAVHAAGTTRSVEDLMQLIGSLRDHRVTDSVEARTPAAPPVPAKPPAGTVHGAPAAAATRTKGSTPLAWPRRTAGVLLLLCAAAHLPLRWTGTPTLGLAAAAGVSFLCAAAGVALCLSRSPVVAVVSTLIAGALAVGHLLDDRLASRTLAYVLRPDGMPAALPALSAVAAALAALLVVALTVAGLRAAADRAPVV